jgi:hypothetical protein
MGDLQAWVPSPPPRNMSLGATLVVDPVLESRKIFQRRKKHRGRSMLLGSRLRMPLVAMDNSSAQ